MTSYIIAPTQPVHYYRPIGLAVTRFTVQALASIGGPGLAVSRLSIYTMATQPNPMRVTRFAVQALASLAGPGMSVSRLSVYTMATTPAGALRMTRFAVQALAGLPGGRPGVGRFSIYVMAGSPPKKNLIPKKIPSPAPDYDNVNWRDRVVVVTAWRTDITKSQITASEDRRSLASRPTRTIRGTLTGMTQMLSSRFFMWMHRKAWEEHPFPLFSDRTETTENAPSSSYVLKCDTRWRRFWRGQRIVIFTGRTSYDGQPNEEVYYAKIQFLFNDRITVEDPLPTDIPSGSDICPCIDAHMSLTERASAVTDHNIEAKFEASESLGPWTLPSLDNKPLSTPLRTYKGAPIFPFGVIHWGADIDLGWTRKGERAFSGRDVFTVVHGEVPRARYRFMAVQLSREKVFDLLSFWDTIRGRFRHFYMVAPQTHLMVLWDWVALDRLEIIRTGDLETFMRMMVGKHVAFVMKPGSLTPGPYIHEVVAVQEKVGLIVTWELQFSENVEFSAGDVDYLTLAHKVRSTTDELVEDWVTNEACSLEWEMEELLDEDDWEIPDL